MQSFKNLKFSVTPKKTLNFDGEMKDVYTEKDIDDIIYGHTESNKCHYCGYGDTDICVMKMKDGNYIYLNSWSGCLTYSESDVAYIYDNGKHAIDKYNEQSIEDNQLVATISDSLKDLIKMGMTNEDRAKLNGMYKQIKYIVDKKQ